MRLVNAIAGRPAPWDRGSGIQTLTYGPTTLAPAGNTTQSSYTIPSKRQGQLLATTLSTRRNTAAAPSNRAQISTFAAGVAVARAITFGNAADNNGAVSVTGAIVILAGGGVVLNTFDNSTGGTVDYAGDAAIIEYDATS